MPEIHYTLQQILDDLCDLPNLSFNRYPNRISRAARQAELQNGDIMTQQLMSRINYLELKFYRYIRHIEKDGNKLTIICRETRGENNSRLDDEVQKKIDELVMSIPSLFDFEIVDIYGHKVYGYDKS